MNAGAAGPGWFEDPYREHRLRWWDGTAWTGYVSDEAPFVLTLADQEVLRFGVWAVATSVTMLGEALTSEDLQAYFDTLTFVLDYPDLHQPPFCIAFFTDLRDQFDASADRYFAHPQKKAESISAAVGVIRQMPETDRQWFQNVLETIARMVFNHAVEVTPPERRDAAAAKAADFLGMLPSALAGEW